MPGKTQLTLQQGPTRTPATSHIITNRACENDTRNQLVGTDLPETAYPLTHPWHRTPQPPLTINERLITIFLRSNHYE